LKQEESGKKATIIRFVSWFEWCFTRASAFLALSGGSPQFQATYCKFIDTSDAILFKNDFVYIFAQVKYGRP
jgi:hypothetical protein